MPYMGASTWLQLKRSGQFSRYFQGLYIDSDLGPMPKAVLPKCAETAQEVSEDLKDAVKPKVRRLPLSV